jgi:hypothetical protein
MKKEKDENFPWRDSGPGTLISGEANVPPGTILGLEEILVVETEPHDSSTAYNNGTDIWCSRPLDYAITRPI